MSRLACLHVTRNRGTRHTSHVTRHTSHATEACSQLLQVWACNACVVGSAVAAAGGGDRRVTRAAEAEADGGGGQGVRHEEQQGQGLFVWKCGFGLPVWRVLPAWVRLLFVRFAGGAVRLAACAFCWPKDKIRVVKGWGCCCMRDVLDRWWVDATSWRCRRDRTIHGEG